MMNNNWIWLDMDGTIANFYGVDGWLEDLMNLNPRPYKEAEPLYDAELLNALATLKRKGFKIGVISWLSKKPEKSFDEKVIEAKLEWLRRYHFETLLDEIIITAYGVRKADTCRKYGKGILVDDEENNRKQWDLGDTINANENILEILKTLM